MAFSFFCLLPLFYGGIIQRHIKKIFVFKRHTAPADNYNKYKNLEDDYYSMKDKYNNMKDKMQSKIDKLTSENYLLRHISAELYQRLLDKDIKWSADGMELLGDLNFEYDETDE